MADATGTPIVGLRRSLAPDEADSRLVRLGKLAAVHLMSGSQVVTRATFAAASKAIDDSKGRRRGFSEASLATNPRLRAIYEDCRSWRKPTPFRRKGKVDAQIARMPKGDIVTALLVARLATAERETEFALALARYALPVDISDIARIRETRAGLSANRDPEQAPPGLIAKRQRARKGNAKAIAAAAKGVAGQSDALIASKTGLHESTVARHRKAGELAEDDAGRGVRPNERSALMRLAKWDLARALHVERELIRALDTSTCTMAVGIIERERQIIRASPARPN